MRPASIESVKNRIKDKHGDEIVIDENTYTATSKKARFIDKDYGEWWAFPRNIIRGSKHKKRQKERTENTNIEKYGVKRPLQNNGIQEKMKNKLKETYGVDNVSKIEEVKESKLRKQRLSMEEISKRLLEIHKGVLSIVCDSYIDTTTECVLIDKDYGEWRTSLHSIIRGKKTSHPLRAVEDRKKTCVEKYGAPNPMQVPEIALRAAKSSNLSHTLHHWKTGQEIVCVGSYEQKTVQYFNENRINFLWQPKTFTTPSGSTYRPDCYLPDQDLWIEIKGYFYDDAKEKWEWFQSVYPNSELWDKQKLQQLKIL
jgi:hypothetical protein